MNLSSKKSTRGTLTLVLVISVALHVLGLVIFGVIKIAEAVLREEVAFVAPPLEPPPEEIPEYEVNLEQRNEQSAPPRPNPITVDSPDVTLPALDIDINVQSSSSYGRGGGGFGNGTGSGGGRIREMAITANLFGAEVSATKLGVVLDVSFSTHKQIHKVLEEIDKNFKDAIIVLAPGCEISDRKTKLYPLDDFEDAKEDYPNPNKISTGPFIDRLTEQNKEFSKIWKKLAKDERGYVIFVENKNPKPNGLGGSGDAFEFLRDEGVDTIYWFADFQDKLDPKKTKSVISSMKRGGITMFIHDFVAPIGTNNKKNPEVAKERLELLEEMAEKTNGKFFLKVLK